MDVILIKFVWSRLLKDLWLVTVQFTMGGNTFRHVFPIPRDVTFIWHACPCHPAISSHAGIHTDLPDVRVQLIEVWVFA